MRLIDADELKKQILISCLYLAVTGDITDKHIVNLFAEAFVKIIDKAPSIPHHYDCNHDCDALKEITQKWIPCSERLPEEYGEFLVTMTEKAKAKDLGFDIDETYIRKMRYNSNGWQLPRHIPSWINEAVKDEVLAWMPLPKPYREERTEE